MNVLRGIAGRSLSYNIEDQLLTVGPAVYQYNLDGFLRVKVEGADSTVYDYSSRGELLSVNLPSGDVIEYVHDPLGRRIAKKINGSITEKYLWSGLTRLLAVYDGADNLLMRFEYAEARMPVAMTQGGNKYYLVYDQVGSLRAVTDSTGTVIKRVDYDTFGNILSDSNLAFKVPFGFAGGLHDRDTGLVRFGARDYDPQIGRWTAKDPIGFAGGDDDLYGYTLDDPVNFVDPLGLITASGKMKKCLELIFRESVSDVNVIRDDFWLNVFHGGSYATTRRNRIVVKGDINEFWLYKHTVLEEYYHVLKQWNKGTLTRTRYLIELMKKGYDKNKYEIQAKTFADTNLEDFIDCLEGGDVCEKEE
ncbi:MAG: RHS repeat-associated core domain-containing protein [Candidatus Omnitrophota bacterium]|jgi:RHS repeat-associated protein